MKKRYIAILIYGLISLGIAAFCLKAGSQDGAASNAMSSSVLDVFVSIFPIYGKLSYKLQMYYIRRMAHIFEYSLFGFSFTSLLLRLFYKLKNGKIYAFICAILGSIALSMTDELLLQASMAGRTGKISDVGFDLIFSISFSILSLIVMRKFEKKNNN